MHHTTGRHHPVLLRKRPGALPVGVTRFGAGAALVARREVKRIVCVELPFTGEARVGGEHMAATFALFPPPWLLDTPSETRVSGNEAVAARPWNGSGVPGALLVRGTERIHRPPGLLAAARVG